MKTLLSLLILAPAIVFGQASRGIVVPHAQDGVEGNGASTAPFTMPLGESARYQQVYAASEFSGVGNPDLLILSFYFRVDQDGGPVKANIPDIQFDLSTTPKAPDTLSSVFAENVGSDIQTVFGRGPISLRTFGPGGFEFKVPLSTPFLYHPSEGNLLLDIRNFSGGFTTFFDGQSTSGDSISSVLAYTGNGSGSVNSAAGFTRTFGLVTLFEFQPVPEPGTSSLLLLGLGGLSLGLWRRRAAVQEVSR